MSAVVGPRRLGVSGIETEVLEQPTTGSTVAGVTPPRGHVGRIRPGSGQHQRIDVNTRVAQAVDPAMTVHELGIAEPSDQLVQRRSHHAIVDRTPERHESNVGRHPAGYNTR
jgi:hypothetical protein